METSSLNPVPYADQADIDPSIRFGARPHLAGFGVRPDGQVVYDAAISSGSSTLASATARFLSKHVGRMVYVKGAGVAGRILLATIVTVISETAVTISAAASTSVTGAECGWGTDNKDGLRRAKTAQLALGNGMYVDGGCYLSSEPLDLSGVRWYGPTPHIDPPAAVDTSGKFACFIFTANPGVKVSPFPGTCLENIHFHFPGTTGSVDLWEVENYPYQVGLHLGNTAAEPLTIAAGDNYGVGGNGGIFLRGITVTGAEGWAIYAYKLWGQSCLQGVQIYNCGTVPAGGDPKMHGGIWEASECADLIYDGVHIIGVAAGYSGPKRMGCAIKRGGAGSNLEALNRFKIGPTHSKFCKVMVEGKGKYALLEYTAFASSWKQSFFGGAWERLEIGESPTISWLNNESVFVACGSFNLPDFYVRSKKVQLLGWMAEGTTKLNIHYNYPGLTVTGRNLRLVPEQDSGVDSGYPNRVWESMPVAKTESIAHPYSLVPDFSSQTWSLAITAPASFVVNQNLIRLAQGGAASIALAGLTPGEVYTCAFRHRVAFEAALEGSTFRIYETGGADIVAMQVGSSDPVGAGTVTWVLLQFVAPASGNITFEAKNTDFNQTEWIPPFIGYGALTEVCTAGYLIQADFSNSRVTGSIVRHTSDQQVWGDILARKADSVTAALLGRSPANQIGVGLNARFDGTQWVREGNGAYNGGALILCRQADGSVAIAPLPSGGTDADTVSVEEAEGAVRVVAKDGGAEVLGPAATESALSLKKVGASSPTNIEYRLAHMANGVDFILYAYNGTTTFNILEVQHAAGIVLVNGVDVTNLLPAGVAGRFLRSNGGSAKTWAKVDIGDITNVQFAGGVAGKAVKAKSGGALETGTLTLEGGTHIVTAIADNWFLVASGGAVSAFSPTGAAGVILGAPGVIGTISGLAGFDLTTLNSVFTSLAAQIADLQTQIDGKAALSHNHDGVYSPVGHGHSGTTSSAGTPSHSHGWST